MGRARDLASTAGDDLARAALVAIGTLLGVAIYHFWIPGLILAVPFIVFGLAARFQAERDFAIDPVSATRRLELWPLAQLPLVAVVAWVLLLTATSDLAMALFGPAPTPEAQKEVSGAVGIALGGFVAALCTYLFGKENSRLGTAHIFRRLMEQFEFPPNSPGYEAQYLESIEGYEGTVGWGFKGRRVRSQVAKNQLGRNDC